MVFGMDREVEAAGSCMQALCPLQAHSGSLVLQGVALFWGGWG